MIYRRRRIQIGSGVIHMEFFRILACRLLCYTRYAREYITPRENIDKTKYHRRFYIKIKKIVF